MYTEIANGPSQIVIDQGLTTGTWAAEGGLPLLGPGTTSAVGASPPSLTVDGLIPLPPPGGLADLRVNPDLAQDETFAILTNDATTIYVVSPNENGIAFASVAGAGRRYAGVCRYPNLLVRGGARLSLADPLRVDGTLEITERSVLTHPETTTVYEAGLDLQAGSIFLDATSAIDVTGRGYLGGGRGAFGSFGTTLGLVQGVGRATGGAYGGLGRRWASLPEPQLRVVYGNANDPLEPGSGGGGRVRLWVSGTSAYPAASASARGGDGFYADGAAGTVVMGP